MKKIYSDGNSIKVKILKSFLESHGINCILKNEHLTSAIGEVPPIEAWLEIWIDNLTDESFALKLINTFNSDSHSSAENWHCSSCLEENPSNFEICWNCNTEIMLD